MAWQYTRRDRNATLVDRPRARDSTPYQMFIYSSLREVLIAKDDACSMAIKERQPNLNVMIGLKRLWLEEGGATVH